MKARRSQSKARQRGAMDSLKFLIIILSVPFFLQAQSYRLRRDGYSAGGGKAASSHYTTVAAAGIPTLSGMKSASFNVGPQTAVERIAEQLPEAHALLQKFPNPFNQTTTLTWHLPRAAMVRVALYSVRGEEIALLHAGQQQAGVYRRVYDGTDASGRALPSGVYFIRFCAGEERQTVKLTLVR